MRYIEETIELKDGHKAEIIPDEDCEMPYADDDAVRMVVLHRRYSDPSKGALGSTPEEVEKWASKNAAKWFVSKLWMYDHSGTIYRAADANPFDCQWDSGRVGIIALERSEWGNGNEGDEKMLEFANGVCRDYTSWANGDTYGFRVIDADGEEVYSCWGFIGLDGVKDGIAEAGFQLAEEDVPVPAL